MTPSAMQHFGKEGILMKRMFILCLSMLAFALCLMPLALAEGGSSAPETIRVLLDSRAYRLLLDEPVRQEDLDTIIACGLRAPSAVNAQPWHFTVVKNREIADAVIGGSTNGVVIIISVLPGSGLDDLDELVSAFDCGLATQAMYTAAQALGLGSNIYWAPVAYVNETMQEVLAIPDGYQVLMMMTIGHINIDAVSSATSRNDISYMVNYIE